jgi:NADPH:quinone reductase-like Zn-dependent oxidoreductase
MSVLSLSARRKAKRLNVTYSFLFMKANGNQLSRIASLIDAGVIRPIVDKVYPFESTKDALDYVEKGRAKGKVVVEVR